MKKIQDIVYTEKYTTKSWEEKKKYTTVWILMTKEDWTQSINMFGSWLNIYDRKEKEDKKDLTIDDVPF